MSDFIIKEPIDYKALSEAYSECRWRWGMGQFSLVPTLEDVKNHVEYCKEVAATSESHYTNCGGITVRFVNGKYVVSIAQRLNDKLSHPPLNCAVGA